MVLPIRRELTGAPESRRLFCGRDGRAPRSSLGGLERDAYGTPGLGMLCTFGAWVAGDWNASAESAEQSSPGREPWVSGGWVISPERAMQAAAPFQHQAHIWCSQQEGNSRERRSRAGFFAAETAALPGVPWEGLNVMRTEPQAFGLLCRAVPVLTAPAIGTIRAWIANACIRAACIHSHFRLQGKYLDDCRTIPD
jgi:hypothetical protein